MSLFGMSVGKDIKFREALANAGVDAELVDELIKHPDVAQKLVADLRKQLNPPASAFEQLFRTPEQIFDTFAAANDRYGWFDANEIAALREQMPQGFVSTLNSVLTLDLWLGDMSTTFEALWAWDVAVHGASGTWRYDGLRSDKKHLRPLNATHYGSRPFVRWVIVDLTANRGKAPQRVRDANSAGLELLAAAALHPEWPKAINYDTIPGVWLGGMEATVPGEDAWQRVPILFWDQFHRTVGLIVRWVDVAHPGCAVPVVREL